MIKKKDLQDFFSHLIVIMYENYVRMFRKYMILSNSSNHKICSKLQNSKKKKVTRK